MAKKKRTENSSGVALSKEKPTSSLELHYNPKTAPDGTEFTDARDRSYRVEAGGQLRVLNKPRSRVKRLREEKKQKETKKPTRS